MRRADVQGTMCRLLSSKDLGEPPRNSPALVSGHFPGRREEERESGHGGWGWGPRSPSVWRPPGDGAPGNGLKPRSPRGQGPRRWRTRGGREPRPPAAPGSLGRRGRARRSSPPHPGRLRPASRLPIPCSPVALGGGRGAARVRARVCATRARNPAAGTQPPATRRRLPGCPSSPQPPPRSLLTPALVAPRPALQQPRSAAPGSAQSFLRAGSWAKGRLGRRASEAEPLRRVATSSQRRFSQRRGRRGGRC